MFWRLFPLGAVLVLSGCLSIPLDQGKRQRPTATNAAPRGQLIATPKEFACFPGRDLTPRDCDKAKREWEQRYHRKPAAQPERPKSPPSSRLAPPAPAKKTNSRQIPDFAE